MQREWFVFYASFLSAIEHLPETNQLRAYQYLTGYALRWVDPPQWEDGIAYAIYLMAKPQIDKNNERFVNWCKWGAPQWNSNAVKERWNTTKQPKTTEGQPTGEKKQPKEKDKDNVKDNVKEKDKDNVKDNVKEKDISSNEEIKNNRKNKKINYSSEFESFWRAYPRKKGKQKAREAWENAISWGNDPELLIKKASEYATEVRLKKTEEGYIKRPQGRLNEWRFDDEYFIWKTNEKPDLDDIY